jgi:hypothetical protein
MEVGGGSARSAVTGLLTKNVKMNIKTSFFDFMLELQKDSEDISAGTGQFFF